jgi:hypothetical protein
VAIDNKVQASGIPWFQRIMEVAKKTETIIFADAALCDPTFD